MRRLPLLLAACILPLAAQEGEALLAQVDRLRHPWPAFSVDLEVRDGEALQRWRLAARDGDARLDGLSEREEGRTILVLGDQMWLQVPGSKRALRVTPQQRLLGPAAAGDAARTRFHDDYRVEAAAEDTLDGRPCWRLDLAARSPATSARTVRLWASREPVAPLKAEFFLASGKRARTATFGPPAEALGRPVLSRMTVTEASGAAVELRFSRWSRAGAEPGRFVLAGGAPPR